MKGALPASTTRAGFPANYERAAMLITMRNGQHSLAEHWADVQRYPLEGTGMWHPNSDALPAVEHILRTLPGTIVAGGMARWCAFPGAPEAADIDVFVLDGKYQGVSDLVTLLVAQGYYPVPRQGGGDLLWRHPNHAWPIQFIFQATALGREQMKPWTTAWAVISTFGFTCEQWALSYENDDASKLIVTTTGAAVNDTDEKVLFVNHIIDPIRLAYRANKYGLKGFRISLSEMTRIIHSFWSLGNEDQDKWLELDSKSQNDPSYQGVNGQ